MSGQQRTLVHFFNVTQKKLNNISTPCSGELQEDSQTCSSVEQNDHSAKRPAEIRATYSSRKRRSSSEELRNSSVSLANGDESKAKIPRLGKGTRQKLVQLHIDAGQKNFSLTQCALCGMKYTPGVKADEALHRKFHDRKSQPVSFSGWVSEKVIFNQAGTFKVVMICKGDRKDHWNKVRSVCELVENELGISGDELVSGNCRVLLYVANQRVIGFAVVEPFKSPANSSKNQIESALSEASKSVEDSSLPQGNEQNPTSLGCEFRRRSFCGVRFVWVHQRHRRKGIGSKLLDVVRERAFPGLEISKKRMLFAQTDTAEGKSFIRAYMGSFRCVFYNV